MTEIETMSNEELEKYLRLFRKELLAGLGITEIELKNAEPTSHYCSAECRVS